MPNKAVVLLVMVIFAALVGPVNAQGDPDAETLYQLNMRTGPGANYDVVTVLPTGTGLVFEARSADTGWLLGRTVDGAYRGWVSVSYLQYATGFAVVRLPVSSEIVGAPAPAPADQPPDTVPAQNSPSANAPSPGTMQATTELALNLRTGPGQDHDAITLLPANTLVVIEGRNAIGNWFLVHTPDNGLRGWVASGYLALGPGITLDTVPVIGETPVNAPVPVGEPAPAGAPVENVNITVGPSNIPGRVHQIYQHGQTLGNRPDTFIKFGDSVTVGQWFLTSFADDRYDLGGYGHFQATIDLFNQSRSFNLPCLTADSGFTSAAVLDSTWTNPEQCESGESPLACEVRLKKPSIAIIYFGPNDMHHLTVGQYQANMNAIVTQLIDLGVIPVLTTFAIAPDHEPDLTPQFLGVIRSLAAQHQVPLIAFHDASQQLPDYGVLSDGYHLTFRNDWFISFSGDQNQYGKTLRELMTLQVLDDLRRTVMGGG
ncbi:MAG: SH3 domain-containing protein [Anaerolineae bacterium]|nr:SH3 domain-containing protein [Anaerolineae bacterium]